MGSSMLVEGLTRIPALDALPGLLASGTFLENLPLNLWLFFEVALGLGFVIFVHELGHFIAAKTFGVRCDKFYVGFDVPISIGPIRLPRTLGKFQWGETEYGIGIIPLGGYVKMLGQDDDPRRAEEEAERVRQGGSEEEPLDPRSYPAKPVWQRMIIISAGVVMNLIFAVIMAGVAFQVGVPYTPTVIGTVTGGGPAWQVGLQPEDQIVRVGEMTQDDTHLRFNDFMTTVAMRGFEKKGAPLPVAVIRGDERIEFTPSPINNMHPKKKLYFIGVSSPSAARLSDKRPVIPMSFLESQGLDLIGGDRITAVDGVDLPKDQRFDEPLGSELQARLQAKWNQSVKLTIHRDLPDDDQLPKIFDLEIPPAPVRTLGIGFGFGEITAFASESAARDAGMQVGDVIEEVNGEKVVDAWRLPTQLAELAGETVEIKVTRSGKTAGADKSAPEKLTFMVECDPVPRFDSISSFGGRLTLAGIGVAFKTSATVTDVDAAVAETDDPVLPGDELVQVLWEPTEEIREQLAEYGVRDEDLKARQIDGLLTMASYLDELQQLPPGMTIRCFFKRDGKTLERVLTIREAEDWYWPWDYRGLGADSLEQIYVADSFAAALALGAGETWKRFKEVLSFLKILITGKAGADGFGGPVKIFQAAGSEASHGISRLLLFLTLLSANLAILNFLPIPALDGGHMVFLTAEAIRGKPINEALQIRLTMVGVLCLLSLMGFVIVKDIFDLF